MQKSKSKNKQQKTPEKERHKKNMIFLKNGKKIKVSFEGVDEVLHQKLIQFINDSIMNQKAKADDHTQTILAKSKREHVRINFDNFFIKAKAYKTTKLPEQEFEAMVLDMSIGGVCLCVDPNVKLTKSSIIDLFVDEVEKDLIIKARILGLQYDDYHEK